MEQGVLSRQELIRLLAEQVGAAVTEVEGEVLAVRIHRAVPLAQRLGTRGASGAGSSRGE